MTVCYRRTCTTSSRVYSFCCFDAISSYVDTGSYPNAHNCPGRRVLTGFSHGRAPSPWLRLYPLHHAPTSKTYRNVVTGDAVEFDHRHVFMFAPGTTTLEIPCKILNFRYPIHASCSPQLLPTRPGIPDIQAIILHLKLMKRSIVVEYRQCSSSHFVTTFIPSQPSVRKPSVRTVRKIISPYTP